ncbi:MAG: RDD family protein [Aliiglaciecola sp.]
MTKAQSGFPRAGFFRRLAAMIYDLLVAVAVAMCAGLVFMLFMLLSFENGLIPKQGYEHFMDFFQQSLLYKTLAQLWVGAWVLGFFLWFWRNGGQTIGMRAWRLRLFSTTDRPMGYGRALLRILCSLGGIGTLLVLLDIKHKQSLQDRLAKTEMLVLTKDANHHKAWKSIQD